MTDTTNRLLLRPGEAAERLGIGRSSLFELLATRELKSIKMGRRRMIAVVDLEAFVEHRRQATEAEEREIQLRLARRGRL